MLNEWEKNKKFNIKYFYFRRALRIWPLYYLLMVLGVFVLPNIINTITYDGNTFLSLFFLNNFDLASSYSNSPIGIAWSVAIEEQFYIFWGLVFLVFKKKKLFFISIFIFVFSVIYSFYNVNDYYNTIVNVKFLMIGCMGGQLFYYYPDKIKTTLNSWIKTSHLISLRIILFLASPFLKLAQFYNEVLILPILFLIVILKLATNSDNCNSLLSSFGKYTYGAYLLHPLIFLILKIIFDKLGLDYQLNHYLWGLIVISALIATLLASIISYKYYESYFLKLKKKFSV